MITRLVHALGSRLRAVRLRMRGARLEGPVWLRDIEVPSHAGGIRLGAGAALDRGVTLLVCEKTSPGGAIRIGSRVYINRHTMIDASVGIEIGDDCMIGPFCYITDHDHSMGENGRPAAGRLVGLPVKLEPGCWIGAHVTILKGVRIGAGAIVGAGSVVTKDIPAGAVFAGNPARAIRPRA
ncbi:MAG: acyltransferase [Verrucomicrobiota bacterium]